MRFLAFLAILVFAVPVFARDQIRVVGSSTVFPFVAAAAEQFGRGEKFRTPIVESTGTGGGIKMFCDGIGTDFPDMANASRAIKSAEIDRCKANGITAITELKIGYDGIVLANALESPTYALSIKTLFLALARNVPDGKGGLKKNSYKTWKQVDGTLPDVAIEVYGPPPTSGTRDAFSELVMEQGCKEFSEFAAKFTDTEALKKECMMVREDGAFIEAGENDNLIVQKLTGNEHALGIFGYSFLEQNAAIVKANPINGVMPTFEAIVGGDYKVARSLYVYVKNQQDVAGLREFATLLTSDAAVGDDGFLIMKGLLPLHHVEHAKMKEVAAELKPMF